jgi:hypothetical protein
MITIAIDPESFGLGPFGLGFIVGTSVYVVASSASYMLYCAGKRLVSLFHGASASGAPARPEPSRSASDVVIAFRPEG